jgi:hypothetical protein
MWADIPSEEIIEIFHPLFDSASRPAEMAVFTRREEGRLHCEVIAYFSPAAADVADALDAHPCEKPAREGLELLAGNENCWLPIFGESEK